MKPPYVTFTTLRLISSRESNKKKHVSFVSFATDPLEDRASLRFVVAFYFDLT